MKQRIITAIFLIIGFLFVLFALPDFAFSVIIFALLMVATWEWIRVTKIEVRWSIFIYAITAILFFLALQYWWLLNTLVLLSIFHYFYGVVHIVRYEKITGYRVDSDFLVLSGPVILACLSALLVLINAYSSTTLLYIVLIIAAADSGAYFVGRFFGKRKLAPKVSPKKTKEGLIGGLISVIIVGVLFKCLLLDDGLSTLALVIITLLTALFSVVGDLYISVIKRQNNIKDSSQILPGHGGILDRIDGILAGVPIFYFLALLY